MRRSACWFWGFVLLGCGAQSGVRSAVPGERPPSSEASRSLAANGARVVGRTRNVHIGTSGVSLDGQVVVGVGLAEQILKDEKVVLSADGETPFGKVSEVLSLLLDAKRPVIGVAVGGAVQEVELGRGYLQQPDEGAVLVLIVASGIGFKGPGGNVAPGCQAPGPGIAIPRTDHGENYVAASACISTLTAAAGLSRYHLAVDSSVPFREVDATVSALSLGGGQLVGIRIF